MAYTRKALRKMPPYTRKVARLLNELESVHRRLRNALEELSTLEMKGIALDRSNRGRLPPDDELS